MGSKQIIVMKKFPKDRNMRTGKYCSQAAHASTGALLGIGKIVDDGNALIIPLDNSFVRDWVIGRFTKITVYVENDEDLIAVYDKAKNAGLPVSLIKDAGLTEFNGIPTLTAVGIGPGDSSKIDLITGNLPLF